MSKKTKTKQLRFTSIPNNLNPQNWAKTKMVEGVTKEYLVDLVKNAKGNHRFKGRDLKFLHYTPAGHLFQAENTDNDPIPQNRGYRLSGDARTAFNMLVEYASSKNHGMVWDPAEKSWVKLNQAA